MWAHAVNTRLVLMQTQGGLLCMLQPGCRASPCNQCLTLLRAACLLLLSVPRCLASRSSLLITPCLAHHTNHHFPHGATPLHANIRLARAIPPPPTLPRRPLPPACAQCCLQRPACASPERSPLLPPLPHRPPLPACGQVSGSAQHHLLLPRHSGRCAARSADGWLEGCSGAGYWPVADHAQRTRRVIWFQLPCDVSACASFLQTLVQVWRMVRLWRRRGWRRATCHSAAVFSVVSSAVLMGPPAGLEDDPSVAPPRLAEGSVAHQAIANDQLYEQAAAFQA